MWCYAASRRHRAVLLAVVLGFISMLAPAAPVTRLEADGTPTAPPPNPIVTENQQTGTSMWRLPTAGAHFADDSTNQIKGFTDSPSVNLGGSLTFYVTVTPAQSFNLDFYRMGWYGGQGGRLMASVHGLPGVQQPPCPIVDASTNLLACSWAASYTLSVPSNWVDGVFMAVLTNAQKYQNYVPFVIRNDSRSAALLYQQPVNTYQAYNNWGGYSLYDFNSTGGRHADKVAFDRPYAISGAGDFFRWEVFLVQWLEQQGYDVTYSTDVDTQLNAARLQSVQGFLSAGHDEYWTAEMYDAALRARDAGVSLAFFGSNPVYWQARYEPSPSGVPDRVLVCYKTNEAPKPTDPETAANPPLTTTEWRLPPVNRSEQALLGLQFVGQTGSSDDQTVPYVVVNSSSWVYANSGLHDGDTVPGIVGYEVDRVFPDAPEPAAQSITVLAESPFQDVSRNGVSDIQNTVLYQAQSGAWVLAAGTMSWSWALAKPGLTNAGLQRVTANILNRFVAGNAPGSVAATGDAAAARIPTAGAAAAPVAAAVVNVTQSTEQSSSTAGTVRSATGTEGVASPPLTLYIHQARGGLTLSREASIPLLAVLATALATGTVALLVYRRAGQGMPDPD